MGEDLINQSLINILKGVYRKKYGKHPTDDLISSFIAKMLTSELPDKVNNEEYKLKWFITCFNNYVIDEYRKENCVKNTPKKKVDIENVDVIDEDILGYIHPSESVEVYEDYMYMNLEDCWINLYESFSEEEK